MKKITEWKIVRLLGKMDFCVVLICMIYSFFVNCMSIIVDYEYLVFNVPDVAAVIICILVIIFSIFILKYYQKNKFDKKHMAVYLSWFVAAPVIYNIFFIFIGSDALYDYTNVLFGGLGNFVYRIFVIALAVTALIIFIIARVITNVRHKKGKYIKPETVIKIKAYIHAVLFILVIILLIILLVMGIWGMIDGFNYKKKEEAAQAFREEMESKIHGGNDFTSVLGEAKLIVMFVETGSEDLTLVSDIEKENGNAFKTVHVNKSTVMEGITNYIDFKKDHSLSKHFYDGMEEYGFDDENKVYNIGYESEYTMNGENEICTIVCEFDPDWNLNRVYCVEGELD